MRLSNPDQITRKKSHKKSTLALPLAIALSSLAVSALPQSKDRLSTSQNIKQTSSTQALKTNFRNQIEQSTYQKLNQFLQTPGLIGKANIEANLKAGENMKPSGDLSVVYPLVQFDRGFLLSQTQINHYYVNNNDREALNIGLGYRKTSSDLRYFYGINTFYDIDSETNQRASLGLEFVTAAFQAYANIYQCISGQQVVNSQTEQTVSGYDAGANGQVPHLPWLSLSANTYKWHKINAASSSYGTKLTTIIRIAPALTLVLGIDDNNLYSTDKFLKCTLSYPAKNIASLSEGIIASERFNTSQIGKIILQKVTRTNNINLETSETSSTNTNVIITRLD